MRASVSFLFFRHDILQPLADFFLAPDELAGLARSRSRQVRRQDHAPTVMERVKALLGLDSRQPSRPHS